MPGTAVFLTRQDQDVPALLKWHLMQNKALHTNIVVLTILIGTVIFVACAGLIFWTGRTPAQDLAIEHADCVFFGPRHEEFANAGLNEGLRDRFVRGRLTGEVTRRLESAQAGPALPPLDQMGLIDREIFGALRAANVTPAAKASDAEYIRRVTLDLTGRIPSADRVRTFLADTSPDKRARLVEELLATPEWVDKWTMYFGDHFKNNSPAWLSTTADATRGACMKCCGPARPHWHRGGPDTGWTVNLGIWTAHRRPPHPAP